MQVIIHDLTETEFLKLGLQRKDQIVISNQTPIRHCIGCFGCWIKTPGVCLIRDDYGDMGQKISKCNELLVISKCTYGGYSPFVKNVFDRSISYIHPNFTTRNHEMHHKRRYQNKIDYQVWFYGDITDNEEETARKLVIANGINFDTVSTTVEFYPCISDLYVKIKKEDKLL